MQSELAETDQKASNSSSVDHVIASVLRGRPRVMFVVAILVICNSVLYLHIFSTDEGLYYPQKGFTSYISDWVAEDVAYDEEVMGTLSADEIIYKRYHRSGNPPITVFMAFYVTLEKADRSHSPIVCYTGQGWAIEDASRERILVPDGDSVAVKANQIILKKQGTTMITLYWYQSAYGAFTNRGIQKVMLLLWRLTGRHEENAFVRVTVTVPRDAPVEKTASYLHNFVSDFYPVLEGFFL